MEVTRSAQNGLMTGTTLGTLTTTVGYNTFGEVDGYDASTSGASIFTTSYTRDKLGRITAKAETVSGVTDNYTYTYDTAGRLTDVTKNGLNIGNYTFDANSNRTGYTGQLGSVTATYDSQDRLLSYGTNTYSYTRNGELTSKVNSSNGDITSYSYDVIGNLMSATMPDGTQVDYVIDARNRRVGKKVGGVLTQGFLYGDQLNPVAELDGAGNVVARFVYGTKGNVPDYMVRGGNTYRIVSDHLGSPRLIVDATTGAVVQQLSYDEFGNILSDTNPGFQPFGFAGGIYDQHTKLTRFGARDYDAETGRWTAKDPIGFAGGDVNLYGYAVNDSINWSDVWGYKPGDKYPTQDQAAIDAINDINATSIYENREYGGLIYLNEDTTYSYTEPVSGDIDSVHPGIPVTNTTGYYHTHAAYDSYYGMGNEIFSPPDKNFATTNNITGYLGTPTGLIKKYNPKTRDITTIFLTRSCPL